MPAAVHQVLVTFHHGDAMGNEALAIRSHLRRAGLDSEIFAERIDDRLRAEAEGLDAGLAATAAGAALVFHYSGGGSAARRLRDAPGRLVLMYHNLTPPAFLERWDAGFARELAVAREDLAALRERVDLGLAKSEFSRRELDDLGYARTGVLPYVLDLDRYRGPASSVLGELLSDGRANLAFVGRVVPNKRIEDLVQVAAALRRLIGPRFRLVVAGDTEGVPAYARALERLACDLGVRDEVLLTGRLEEHELLAVYSSARAYLSLSEHEGYGVPLVEAMLFGVPVVAYAAGAVAETLQGAGVLLREKPPVLVAGLVAELLEDGPLRRAVLAGQDERVLRLRATDWGALVCERLAPALAAAQRVAGAPA